MSGRVNSYQRVESTGELISSVKTPSLLAFRVSVAGRQQPLRPPEQPMRPTTLQLGTVM